MMKRVLIWVALAVVIQPLSAQQKKKPKKPPEFKWVNPIPKSQAVPGLRHGTQRCELFVSQNRQGHALHAA